MINDKYSWTKHSQYKMRFYGLSQQRIKRVIRYPARIEEAIVSGMVAAMSSAGKQAHKGEIWAMYKIYCTCLMQTQTKIMFLIQS